jgi:hypothetical protein
MQQPHTRRMTRNSDIRWTLYLEACALLEALPATTPRLCRIRQRAWERQKRRSEHLKRVLRAQWRTLREEYAQVTLDEAA